MPFLVYSTDTTLKAIADLPVIQAQPGAAHTFRIYEAWHIERGNAVFAPLAAAWGGTAVLLAGLFDGRKSTAAAGVGLATAIYTLLWFGFSLRLGTAGDPRTWLPLPALPALLALALGAHLEWPAAKAEWLAGAAFAGLTVLVWPPSVGAGFWVGTALVLAVSVAAFKATLLLAAWVGTVVAKPVGRRVLAIVVILGFLVPLALGVVDFYLRANTA